MDREIVEFVVFGGVAILAFDNVLWWIAALGTMERPLPRALWPAGAAAIGLLTSAVALTTAAFIYEVVPEHFRTVSQYVRDTAATGVFVAVIAQRWWRSGWRY